MCGYELGGKGDGRWREWCLVNIIFKLETRNFFTTSTTTSSQRHLLTTSATSGQFSETLIDHVRDFWPALRDTY